MVYLILGFVFGACLGSFAKALADRSLKKRSFLGRSYCESCKHNLSWYDLFPIFSYLMLAGRCRYCRRKLSKEYLIVEIITGLLVAFLWFSLSQSYTQLFDDPLKTILFLLDVLLKTFFVTILVSLFLTDVKKMFIPDRIILPSIVVAALWMLVATAYKISYLYYNLATNTIGKFLLPPHSKYFYIHTWMIVSDVLYALLMCFGIGGFFLFLIIITKGKGMGGGDVKLGAFIGLVLGFPYALVAILLSFVTGAFFALSLIVLGKKSFGQVIPFGPFLVLGSFIALFWGQQIWDWYLQFSS